MKTLLAADGNSILNRAFYGAPPLTSSDGTPVGALYAMMNMLLGQCDSLLPDAVAVAFDLKAPTFRHKLYADYKAGRHATPPELLAQFPYAKELIRAMGWHVLEAEGHEADDILGTLSAMADADGNYETYILTGDRDALQLISDKTRVLLCGNKDTVTFDEKTFREKYGIPVSSFVDLKAMMGDPSDNIPGIPGVGEKTAVKLLCEFGSLDGLYADLEKTKFSPSLGEKIKNGKDSAYLSRTLSKIESDAPVGVSLAGLASSPRDAQALSSLLSRLELHKLMARLGISGDVSFSVPAESGIPEKTTDELCALLDGKLFSIVECGDYREIYDGEKSYILKEDFPAAGRLLNPPFRFVCHDVKALAHAAGEHGQNVSGCVFDTMLAGYVLNSGESSFTRERLCAVYKTEANDPAQAVFGLYGAMLPRLREEGSYDLLTKVEIPTALVLADMEKRGFLIDPKGLLAFGAELSERERELCERIYMFSGCEFNINSPKQLGEVLFEKLHLPAPKKKKTGWSTASDILEKLERYSPVVTDVLEYRHISKLRSTYVEGLTAKADEGGRVHTSFEQCRTATGRLSSAEPNLQNIPIRTELGKKMRRYFLPAAGCLLIDADYSQIELRLMAHISGDENMKAAFISGADIHRSTAAAVFGVPEELVTHEMRSRAKAVNFGIIYGIGAFSLAEDIHVSRAEAQEYINSYLARFPKVGEYLSRTVSSAYRDGYVTTLLGRRRYIPELAPDGQKSRRAFGERVAMNSPIQGTAADIIKLAMVNTARALEDAGLDAHLILQVHDELIVEAAEKDAPAAAEILKREMENAFPLSIPLPAEVSAGKDWLSAK